MGVTIFKLSALRRIKLGEPPFLKMMLNLINNNEHILPKIGFTDGASDHLNSGLK